MLCRAPRYDRLLAYFDDTWAWDGTSWTQMSVTGPFGPLGGFGAAMAAAGMGQSRHSRRHPGELEHPLVRHAHGERARRKIPKLVW